MSEYSEYGAKASEKGHKKPGPGAENSSGQSSGCMVVAPVPAAVIAAALLLIRRSRR